MFKKIINKTQSDNFIFNEIESSIDTSKKLVKNKLELKISNITENSIIINWEQINVNYNIILIDEQFNKEILNVKTNNNFIEINDLKSSSKYILKVFYSKNNDLLFDVINFTTLLERPNIISAFGRDDMIYIEWKKNKIVNNYKLTISRDTDFNDIYTEYNNILIGNVQSIFLYSKIKTNNIYFIKLIAINNNTYSLPAIISIKVLLDTPLLEINNILTTSAYFIWTDLNYSSYDFEISNNPSFLPSTIIPNPSTTLNLTSLIADTQYFARVRGKEGESYSSYSNILPFFTLMNSTVLSIDDYTHNSVDVSFNSVIGAINYKIQYSDNDFLTYQEINTLLTSLTITNLNENSEYKIRVIVQGNNSLSVYSNIETVLTRIDLINFTIDDYTENSVTISYENTPYTVLLSVATDNLFNNVILSDFNITNINQNYIINSLNSCTKYFIKIRLYDNIKNNYSIFSNIQEETTEITIPSLISITSTSYTISVDWSNVNNAVDYVLNLNGGSDIIVLNSDNIFTLLSPESNYTISIKSRNSTLNRISQPLVLNISTKLTPPTLDLPFNMTNNSMEVNWSNNINAISYQIQIATDNLFSNILNTYNTSNTNYLFNLLTPDTFYYFRVRSQDNLLNYSDWSNIVSEKTLLIKPIVFITDISENSAIINWYNLSANQYIIEVSLFSNFSSSNTYYTNDLFFQLTNLQEATQYYVRVMAEFTSSYSEWSDTEPYFYTVDYTMLWLVNENLNVLILEDSSITPYADGLIELSVPFYSENILNFELNEGGGNILEDNTTNNNDGIIEENTNVIVLTDTLEYLIEEGGGNILEDNTTNNNDGLIEENTNVIVLTDTLEYLIEEGGGSILEDNTTNNNDGLIENI